MKKNAKNKGFSLVELIIVIAIMAILVAIMAPILLRYVEKARISADIKMLDSVYAALAYAASDPDVVQEMDSMTEIEKMVDDPMKLEDIDMTTLFGKEALDTLGWDSFSQADYVELIQSAHSPSSTIYVQYKGSADNPLAMWISDTDNTGKKRHYAGPATSGANAWRALEDPDNDASKVISIH